MEEHNIKVSTRVRPLNIREIEEGSSCCVEVTGNKILLHAHDATLTKKFTFDQSYWSCNSNDPHYAGQARLFEDIGERVVQCTAEGYNSCVFAYGQTGSGKTHTMMGSDDAERGLVPRICQALLDLVQRGTSSGVNHRVSLSYLEIYNEKIRDLLCDRLSKTASGTSKTRKSVTAAKDLSFLTQDVSTLKIRRSKENGIHVPDLTQVSVTNYEEVEELLHFGNARRSTAGTLCNAESSRSHAVLTLNYSRARLTQDDPSEISSKLHLVDLAGSERVKKTGATGARLTEGSHINRSLSTLSNVLRSLSKEGKAAAHVPYRDSLLTHLLQDSLGGNSKTFMIATISPASSNYEESLSTLRYAARAKLIVNNPIVNEDPNVKLIRELRDQIKTLEVKVEQLEGQQIPDTELGLTQMQHQEQMMTKRWHQRWADGDRLDCQEETPRSSPEWPSPILDASRVVKRLEYPEPTDSGVASPEDSEDECFYDSYSSFNSSFSALHDDDDEPTSSFPLSSLPSSAAVKLASGESNTWELHTKSVTQVDRHSTPTRNVQETATQCTTPPEPPQKESRSTFTQTFQEDDLNVSLRTRVLDELARHLSRMDKDAETSFLDLSASCSSEALLNQPDDACSKILASIIEKEVQNRVSMSLLNSSTNNGASFPAGFCGISSKVDESLASTSHFTTVDMPQGYNVDVGLEYRVLVGLSFKHYYVVNYKAGSESWLVYAKFNDVKVLKTYLELKYPSLNIVFEKHAAIFHQPERGLEKLPTKQELKNAAETTIESYKKKLDELSDLHRQNKVLEEKNADYMQHILELEEDVEKNDSWWPQLDLFKKQVVELRQQLADETKKADQVSFENKKLAEKVEALTVEKDRVSFERDGLYLHLEQQRCQRSARSADPRGDRPHGDLLATHSQEVGEKLMRLHHENLQLKKQQQEGQSESVLQAMVIDLQERHDNKVTENRWINQRIMELESEVEKYRTRSIGLTTPTPSNASTMMAGVSSGGAGAWGDAAKRELEIKLALRTEEPSLLPDVSTLRQQLHEKDRHIENLERESGKSEMMRDMEKKLITSAFYNFGMNMHRQMIEQRLSAVEQGQHSYLPKPRSAIGNNAFYDA